jgi:hypothetical protein
LEGFGWSRSLLKLLWRPALGTDFPGALRSTPKPQITLVACPRNHKKRRQINNLAAFCFSGHGVGFEVRGSAVAAIES